MLLALAKVAISKFCYCQIHKRREGVIRMDKDSCQINITKKDDGFIVEVTGKNIGELCGCVQHSFDCCVASDCCPDSSDASQKDDGQTGK